MSRGGLKRASALALGALLLGLSSVPAAAVTTLTRTTTFTYDPVSGLMTQSVTEPSDPTFRVQTDIGRDAFGNVTSTTVSGAGIANRVTGTGYDAKGRFPTTLTNALTQVTTQAFSAAFGEVTSVTDPNNIAATATFDSWGRKTQVVNADGTMVKYFYEYCSGINGGTQSCPANGAYRVVATQLAADGVTQIGSYVATYFDILEREIERYTESFNAGQIRVRTKYDALGRVLQVSRPYFSGVGSPAWTTFAYDALDRVTLETRPDTSTIGHAYHGLTVVDTNQLGQTQTTVKNSRGEVVSVTDDLSQTTLFAYDPFGNLTKTTDSLLNEIVNTYDLYGRKVAMSDPDMGDWSYGYDVLGQLTSQTNANLQTVTLTYDVLGRLTNRVEPSLTSAWTYDTQTKGIGKLASTSTTAGFLRTVSYDSLGRPTQTAVTVDSLTYTTTSTYNSAGRLATVAYPSTNTTVTYNYNTKGYLTSVTDGASLAYWTANAYDAESHLTQSTAGNGVVTSKVYNANTGRIETIKSGPGDSVQDLSFDFNTLGNLIERIDAVAQVTDTMDYDDLNRLTEVVTSNPSLPLNVTKTVAYDAIGNITNKSDVGDYTYDPARVHAVAGIVPGTTGTLTATYTYDGNGNLLTGNGRTVTWTSFDMVDDITQGANSLGFVYDSERNRLKQVSSDGSTKYYLNDPISGIMAEKIVGASLSVTWNDYIMVGSEMVALKVSGATSQIRYFHKDHLGSITALTDATGALVEVNSFDAWGHRRVTTGPDDPLYPSLSLTSQITRGYTGHEQLDQVGFIHMNGRIYDPVIGKMLSADPTVPNPIDGQSYNRYSYVYNNPLSLTDPSGFAPVDKDMRGFPKGEPAHKSTDFKSHAEFAHAGDISRQYGISISTRAEFLSAVEMLDKAYTRALLRGRQIASCLGTCPDWTGQIDADALNIPSYTPEEDGWHDYTVLNEVCSGGLGCSRDEIIDQLSRYAYPGQDPTIPVKNRNVYMVKDPTMVNMRAGRVISYVSEDGLTVKNVTLPDHVLYDGQITRRAFQVENGAWFVETHGIGNNVRVGMDYANQWHGPEVFNDVDRRMKENIEMHHGIMY